MNKEGHNEHKNKECADICLILEGTYPYVTGGVANWAHDLISEQKDLTYHLVTILPPSLPRVIKYEIPKNVLSVSNIIVQDLPKGNSYVPKKNKLFSLLDQNLDKLYHDKSLSSFEKIIKLLQPHQNKIGRKLLFNSQAAWKMLLNMYERTIPDEGFLDFFWSYRSLLGGFFSVVLAEYPQAKVYHTLCTGYAGLLATRAQLETGQPSFITEHGIYTNERRIEIASAEWFREYQAFSLSFEETQTSLRQFWINTFTSYSKICYQACKPIVTLYQGNTLLQISDGANPKQIRVIPNGVDLKRFSKVKKDSTPRPFTVALVGRVVPIKDVKTYIRTCAALKEKMPNSVFYIMGPYDEDEGYYNECMELVKHFKLGDLLQFLGKVRIDDYFGKIDLIVLTSISEAQPLVILEAGAVGIPSVATDVGACSEMILGASSENPALGPGGIITKLANPQDSSEAIYRLYKDKEFYNQCSKNIRQRVKAHYDIIDLNKTYGKLYSELLETSNVDI